MKKLIVIGIAAMMVMGLAGLASAAVIDTQWGINLQAYNQNGEYSQGTAIFGTKTGIHLVGPPVYDGATDGYTQAGSVQTGTTDGFKAADGDALLAPQDPDNSLIGVYTKVLKMSTSVKMTAGDIRAPIVGGVHKIWQFYVTGGSGSFDVGGATEFTLYVRKPADAQWANDGTVQMQIYSVAAFGGTRTLLWDSRANAAGDPLLIWTSPTQEAGGGSYKFELDAVPEPGSILALASGLVGLIGFGIRRRK